MKVDYSYITSDSIEGLTGMDELEQRARIYDSIDRKIILRLIAEERAKVSPDAPAWNDVREELIEWIADNTVTFPQSMYYVNADDLFDKINDLLPAPPDTKEG